MTQLPVRPPAGRTRPGAGRLSAERLLVAAALALCAWLLFARLTAFEYGRDQGVYDAVAEVVARGGAPYRDAWDVKTPGIFFAYAAARGIFGPGMQAVRWLEALCFASLVAACAIFSRRHLGSAVPGLLGGALAVCGHVWLGFWQTAQPESFGAVAVVWALVLSGCEPRPEHRRAALRRGACWLGAGVLWGGAALLKPTLAGGLLVSLLGIAARRRGRGALAALAPPALALGVGAALPLAATLLYFVALGAESDLAEALFVYAPRHAQLTLAAGPFTEHLLRALRELLVRFSFADTAGLALLLLLPPLYPREREGLALVAGVLATQVVGVALQARFFPYHYGAALPLLALLAGLGFWKLLRVAPRPSLAALAVVGMVGLLADGTGPGGDVPGGFLARLRVPGDGHHYNAPRRRVAAWIAEHTPAAAPLYVFGAEPVLYTLSDRRPASRYVTNVPLRAPWSRDAARRILVQELARTPPAAIVVQHWDIFPSVVGDGLDSATALADLPELRNLLRRRYAEGLATRDFTVFVSTQP